MRCYYEELSVAREASDADIKVAYRKLALRWHPDKNPDCLEEAKERFQLIQQAYEVLSDSHERAWYDNHREQILRGKDSDYSENCLDLFQYFTVSCFKGYGDDEKGFYAVYREVFSKIVAEDAEFMEDEESLIEIPSFGDSQSNYEEVVGPFYAYWQSYCTKKTYTWLCPYNIQEIRDRRILREIEKEMKKIVQKAKKERNEEVRNLVSFVRRRDKRAQAYKRKLEERAVLNRQKQEQNRLEQIRRRQQELREVRANRPHTTSTEGYEQQLKQLEQEYSGDSSVEDDLTEEEEDEVDEETYIDDLYCVACNKAFRNENAFANHETSKKHRENVELLKQEMQKDEECFKEAEEEDEEEDDLTELDNLEISDKDKVENLQQKDEEDQEDIVETPANKTKKNKKSKRGNKSNNVQASHSLEHQEEDEVEEFLTPIKAVIDSSDNEDWANTSKKTTRKNKAKGKQAKKTTEAKDTIQSNQDSAAQTPSEPTTNGISTSTRDSDDAAATVHACVTCNSTFPSKNKLFAHLKSTNHGVYIPKGKTAAAAPIDGGKQKKVKGKRK